MVQWLVETYLADFNYASSADYTLEKCFRTHRPFVHSSTETTQRKTRLLNSSVPALTNITPTKPVEK